MHSTGGMDKNRTKSLTYVLITPARDEAKFIELTIKSVKSQSIKPLKWIIVDDGSTDATPEIVSRSANSYKWIELVRLCEDAKRQFDCKVQCFNVGLTRLTGLNYDVIGNLDADVSFDPYYFEFLLEKFAADPRLGVAGCPFTEDGQMYDYRFVSLEHVSGQCQLFRKECFEEIGGYIPLKLGGVCLAAHTTARMMGWKTRSFLEKTLTHHKKTQLCETTVKTQFVRGHADYLLGNDPIWEFLRSIYQMRKRPVRGGALLLGYLYGLTRRANKPVSQAFVRFRRRDQRRRMIGIAHRFLVGSARHCVGFFRRA
jgi:glycosyltransferase involved in cell wall biosynthesis